MTGLRCESCGTRKALWTAIDDPEQDCAVLFGDDALAICLCARCLDESEIEGPWDAVHRIDPRRPVA